MSPADDGGLEVPACCPHCDTAYIWDVDLRVDRELGWAHPAAPSFPFDCPACGERLEISFRWSLERGAAARPLRMVSQGIEHTQTPCILLVDYCPHGCGTKVALQLPADDPWARGRAWPDEAAVLGGYRCTHCDGEGRLKIQPVVTARRAPDDLEN